MTDKSAPKGGKSGAKGGKGEKPANFRQKAANGAHVMTGKFGKAAIAAGIAVNAAAFVVNGAHFHAIGARKAVNGAGFPGIGVIRPGDEAGRLAFVGTRAARARQPQDGSDDRRGCACMLVTPDFHDTASMHRPLRCFQRRMNPAA